MKKAILIVVVVMCCAPSVAWAITIETVVVGDPGNTGELSGAGAGGYGPDRITGAVPYTYRIGKYEVTNAQYTAFRNREAPSYNPIVPTGIEAEPVYNVSFWDAARFCNWLHNGQGNGDTETGSYTLNGYTGSGGAAIVRNPGATWVIPNEDEWYKAAFYKGGGPNAGYWDYATQSNTAPVAELPPGGSNSANHRWATGWGATPVGAYPLSESAYDTFDQNGNLWEWVETVVTGSERGTRGSAWDSDGDDYAHASYRNYTSPTDHNLSVGFRVAQVPEPATLGMLALGGLAMLRRRRK